MTYAAILLVVGVIALLVAIIVFDVFTLGTKGKLSALKQWQTLIGTMLGFVTGAGVLALSTAIQDETRHERNQQALVQVGNALRVEASDLDGVLSRAQSLGPSLMPSDPNKPPGCSGPVNEMIDAFQRETPIYTAAVPNFIEVGEPNLALFVSFYAGFEELARAAKQYADDGCPIVSKDTVGLFYSGIEDTRADFAKIAQSYK